jgi:hypothetical protein
MHNQSAERTARIRELNDILRTTFRGGTIVMTASVNELPPIVRAQALAQMAKFDDFTEDNDPYGEHDFGSFEFCGRKWFWKIDYYDKPLRLSSNDPADPAQTERVLTLMLAEDY